jgi:hypothetical protein
VLGDPTFIVGKLEGKFYKVSWGKCKFGASITYACYLIRYCFNKTEAKLSDLPHIKFQILKTALAYGGQLSSGDYRVMPVHPSGKGLLKADKGIRK